MKEENDDRTMNVLLLYPAFPDTFWSFKHALKFIHKKASLPPLGLATVAAMLPEEWPKRLVDLNVSRLTAEDLAWADLAFVSGMLVQESSAREVIDRCADAGVTVVAGGPLFTIEHDCFPQVDHFVLNEAELTLPLFLADLQAGQAQHIYTTAEFSDMRQTPVPMWELVDLDRYATMSIQYSRGCPHNCEFCNVTALFGHRPRTKSAEQIIAELDRLYDLGWRGGVFFVDDNLIGNRKALRDELLPALIDWRRNKRGMGFNTQVSINLADDEELTRKMAEAGFTMVFIGIETPDEGSLAECSKKTNLNRDLVQDVKRLQRAGLEVQGGFIVGFDHDTPSIFRRQIEFIQNSGIVTAMVGLLQAPPGTRLYQRLKGEGRLLGERMSGDNVDGTTNILPRMNLEMLREGYQGIMSHIYAPDHYYQRVRTFLREYRPPTVKLPLNFSFSGERFMALFRSILQLGIVGKERMHYWRLLLWTLWHRPRLLPQAVTFAVYGYHFRKVCEQRVLTHS
jgi:radical SAM superfamily enzyme YgiQ (UPF0313 family)